jgi:nitrite reductase/ring-hydroxylating ferredoxin subunit
MPWVDALSLAELADRDRLTVKLQGRQILVLKTERGIVAFPNRCPHEGYPLSEGSFDGECRLTCNWHNWKFDVTSGANLTGGDALQLIPVRVDGERLWLNIVEPDPQAQRRRVLAALPEALEDRDQQRLVRETARLAVSGLDPVDAVRTAVEWGHERFRYGMAHGLAGTAEWLALYDEAATASDERLVCIGEALGHIAFDARPNRIYPFALGALPWSEDGFLAAIEREDEAAAVRLLRGALAAGAGPDQLEPVLVRAALAHYQDFGHTLIYAVKSCALVRRLGLDSAEFVWLPYLRELVYARREDLLPEFRDYARRHRDWSKSLGDKGEAEPLDPARLRRRSAKSAMGLVAGWAGSFAPEAIFACVVEAAAWGLLHADTEKFASDRLKLADDAGWLDLTHMVTFAEAGARAASLDPSLWPAVLLQLACFIGRNAAHIAPDLDVSAWQVGDRRAFRAAVRRRLFDHGLAPVIFSVHLLKTSLAAEALGELVPASAATLDAAVNRFFNTPLKTRHVLREARQMQEFVAEE